MMEYIWNGQVWILREKKDCENQNKIIIKETYR